jgi:hypothetical protein
VNLKLIFVVSVLNKAQEAQSISGLISSHPFLKAWHGVPKEIEECFDSVDAEFANFHTDPKLRELFEVVGKAEFNSFVDPCAEDYADVDANEPPNFVIYQAKSIAIINDPISKLSQNMNE